MDAELLPGIACWNAGQYLEAQEEFEHAWLADVGARRQCLRGLVHAAMGFHYMTMRDLSFARSKLSSADAILAGFPADVLGLNLDSLRAGIAAARAALHVGEEDGSFDPAGVAVPPLVPTAPVSAPREGQP